MKQTNHPISSVWAARAYRTSAAAHHMALAVDPGALKYLCHRDPLLVAAHYVRDPEPGAHVTATVAAMWKSDTIQFSPKPGQHNENK